MPVKYTLIQARNDGDIAKPEEHQAFAERLGISVEQIQPLDIFSDDMSIDAIQDTDAVLVGGSGEYSVLDEHPKVKEFIDFLGLITTTDIPMFASCFGFQALVLALGGEIIKAPDRAEVGTFVLRPTNACVSDVLFSTLPNPFNAQLGHQDQASMLPNSVVNLASSELTEFQALKVTGKNVYATQFHPELTSEENRKRFRRYMHIYGALFGEVKAQEILDSHQPSPESNNLLNLFHTHIVQV